MSVSNGLKCILVFMIVCVTIVVPFLIIRNSSNEGGSEVVSISRLSIEQRLENVEEHNDISVLQEKIPWLDIISARWRQIVLSDYLSGVPGPTDIMTIGLLTLDNDYLSMIKEEYRWYEYTARPIPGVFLTNDMKGYTLYSSPEYNRSHRLLFGGRGHLMLAIDFEKGVVFFSF